MTVASIILRITVICALLVSNWAAPATGQSPLNVIEAQREALQHEYEALQRERKAFNEDCAIVRSDEKVKIESCSNRDNLIRGRIAKYQRDLASFRKRKEEIEFTQRELLIVETRLSRTRQAILQFENSLAGFQTSLDEWTQLDEDAKAEARLRSLEGTIELTLELFTLHFERTAEALHQSQVKLAKWRNARQISDDPEVRVLWQTLDKQIDQTHGRASITNALTGFQHGVAVLHDYHEQVRALLGLVGMINTVWVGNPALTLLILDGELVLTDLYAGAAHKIAAKRIEQLTELGADQLQSLRSLTWVYVKDVDKKSRLMKRQAELLKP